MMFDSLIESTMKVQGTSEWKISHIA